MLAKWKEGYDAGWDDDKMMADNPYPKDSKNGLAWLKGFFNGNHDKDISLADMRGEFDDGSENNL